MANVRELKKGEHSLIGNIIGDSFSNDPVNLWIFKQPMGIENFNTKIAKKLYLQEGFGHVMDDGSGGALWLPSSTKRHIPFYKNIDIALSMIRYGGFKSVPQGMLIDHYLTQKKPIEPHYYLYVIGARTNQQGKGIGGKLMTAGEIICVWPDARGNSKGQAVKPLYKSAPKAVKLDPYLYELLALVDAIRLGNTRESSLAKNLLEGKLKR